jgi:anti-sigma regulatory factor (Ser/Thr protein kinase)
MRRRLKLARDLDAAWAARDVVEDLGGELGWRVIDARIVATELVTNSVRHSDAPTDRPIVLDIELDADFVRIEVWDAGTGYRRGVVRRRPPGERGGFGLNLVASLADAWGVTGDGGTCAWALLDRTSSSDAHAPDLATSQA